ncbi:phage antirepressor KilAC domain-containing protein [Xenorhabdus griffiniae]|uniref:Phage antirepressor KilAC domain-containing protein n=1 Tax=Xenorhabdus griffiniae TaxID=351672 RepID=A0ABY9XKS3_9GAMM|nr:phage antirepressor KilAC domain-containing protein [Xenorhabdus griffiniae]MBD1228647.1 phage antirepressor KilAC domain-containing protein [Xenorhabdus griffiniae]MBE8588203.1 phage antirepressor KilAC domain-containing protein [Xenorhabdus griffiniae]WMV73548.1 phage antirepressor KilAC domain-containing protein [Xenorhabdus griffiniae]WNH03228.1 phage antirepressor KilAC domain-containing protein [Xenorhabdus griffiniae]
MNNVANKNLPVIAGVEITTDSEGRFNLNALHKASGLGEEKAPAKFFRNKTAKDLISELEKQTGQICLVSSEGKSGGTFAHELLAIEYAGWISPKFRLQVNQTFIDYRSGKLAPVDPMQVLSDPDALRGILLTYTEKVIALEDKVADMQPDVDAFERIAKKSTGSMCITDAAKHLQIKPKILFDTLSSIKWIYRRLGKKSWIGYQDKLQQGLLEHKITVVAKDDGTERVCEQVLVTAKGISKLAKMLSVDKAA